MTVNQEYKHDVAISFLSRDEPLAFELHARLSQHLAVFVYSKKQEQLAGTNGLETFRSAFRNDARLIVVVFREGWGETPWTRIEQTAITERVLADGWDCLFFIMADRQASPPKWLPNTHIRFNLEDFGIEQAVGAIKARLQELGGRLKATDVLQQAKLVEQRAAFYAERERLFLSHEGVNAVRDEVRTIYREVAQRIADIRSSTSVRGDTCADDNCCVVTNGRISVRATWRPRALNRLEHSPLRVEEFNCRILLPGERGYYFKEPAKLSEHEYHPELSVELGWCWVRQGRGAEYLSSSQVADQVVSRFLDLFDRVASGKIEPPNFLDED
jgi:hypothetical protein